MKRIRMFAVCLLLLFSIGTVQAQDQGGGKILGIMPVADSSGETYGQLFAQNMTAMMYQKLANAPFQVMLLNPGGLYSPLTPESITDYAQMAGVDMVLVTTFLPTDKPPKGDYALHVEAKLVDAKTGKEMAPSAYAITMNRHELLMEVAGKGLDYSGDRSGTVRAGRSLYMAMASGSKPFAKEPLGKAANTMAESVHTQVLSQYEVSKADAPVPPASGKCTITVGVKYVSKKAVSKAYDILVNGLNQSLLTKEGGTTIPDVPAGPLFVQMSVADAPYRLPVQDLYQANTVLDCAAPEHNLFLEIGPVGDALVHWR